MVQMVQESITDYYSFVDTITEIVQKKMGEEYSVKIYKVTKNNALELDSLVVLKNGENYAPNIYLLPYYEAYTGGTSVMELGEKLCAIYRNCVLPIADNNFSYSYEEMKPYIIYRLVSFDRNQKLLDKIPHIIYLDLAITFHCLVRDDEDGIGTIRITNDHMKAWKTSLKDLQLLAVDNTKRLFPDSIRSMDEVIRSMLAEELKNNCEEAINDEVFNQLLSGTASSNQHKMYILSNQKGINGAACLLYENVLRDFAGIIQSDLYILPSSIHEVILVKASKSLDRDALLDMVSDVNQTQVPEEEILSNHVYLYTLNNNSISVL
ncbi:MAG: DUF5688 family protein [Mobilitalea sp.]